VETAVPLRAIQAPPTFFGRCGTRDSRVKPTLETGFVMAEAPPASVQSYHHTSSLSGRIEQPRRNPEIWTIAVRLLPTGRPAQSGNLRTPNPAYPEQTLRVFDPGTGLQIANCGSNPAARVQGPTQGPGPRVENAHLSRQPGSFVHQCRTHFVPGWAFFIEPGQLNHPLLNSIQTDIASVVFVEGSVSSPHFLLQSRCYARS
jgi:hypothetical protein